MLNICKLWELGNIVKNQQYNTKLPSYIPFLEHPKAKTKNPKNQQKKHTKTNCVVYFNLNRLEQRLSLNYVFLLAILIIVSFSYTWLRIKARWLVQRPIQYWNPFPWTHARMFSRTSPSTHIFTLAKLLSWTTIVQINPYIPFIGDSSVVLDEVLTPA